jgi:hypothetical protein
MNWEKLMKRIKPPCRKCPYKLGIVKTPANPCPQCKQNGYSSYEWFQKVRWQGQESKDSGKYEQV